MKLVTSDAMVKEPENLLPFDGEVYYYPGVFSEQESKKYFEILSGTIGWKHESIKMFGKDVMQPRLTAWYGDASSPYTYSGVTMYPNAWTKELSEIKSRVEQLCNHTFNGVLLNMYRDGNDSMGWHRDNEKMLGPAPVIGSVSFGEERVFQFRHYTDTSVQRSVALRAGSVLIMRGSSQQHWQHRLPKAGKSRFPRINLTFRTIFN